MAYTIEVNGSKQTVEVERDTPLLWVLRDELDLKGAKFGCGVGLCGACTVHLDGAAVRSCVTPVSAVGAAAIVTIEGMASHRVGKTVQAAWMELDVPQCGYCQAGQIMSATALLSQNPHPSDRRDRRGDDRQRLPLLHLSAHPRRDQEGGARPIERRGGEVTMTIMTALDAESRVAIASFSSIPSRRAFLTAGAAAGGGLLLQAALPPLATSRMAATAADAAGERQRRSTPTSASRPTASSRSCRRIRKSARASRPCCRW